MPLDTISDGKFVFKNTYVETNQLRMPVYADEAPEEFFFIHINCSSSIGSSCASMLQTSCIVFIRQCHEQGLIDDFKRECLVEYIWSNAVYHEIHEQMKTLGTNQLDIHHKDCDSQAAYIRETISRVDSTKFYFVTNSSVVDCKSNRDAVKGTRLLAHNQGDDLL